MSHGLRTGATGAGTSRALRRRRARLTAAGLRIPEERRRSRGRRTGAGARSLCSRRLTLRWSRCASDWRLPVWYSHGEGERKCCSTAQKNGEA